MKTPTDTNTKELCIVGAKYQLSVKLLDEWLSTAIGSYISIIADPYNLHDPFAVAAWAWLDTKPRKVGYVANEQRVLAHRLLLAYGGKRLRLEISSRRENGTTLFANIKDLEPAPENAVNIRPDWEGWTSPVPPLPLPESIEMAGFIADDIMEMAQKDDCDKKKLREMIEEYLKNSFYDLSLESRQTHSTIAMMLKQRPDAQEWKKEINWLYGQLGRIGTESDGGKVEKKWMDIVMHPDFAMACAKGPLPSKIDVDKALYNFPMNLWVTWVNNRKMFFSRVYYACIPRQVLWSFISTLALHETLACTDNINAVLQSWANQAPLMPDNVVSGFSTFMEWLNQNGYEISPITLNTLLDEVKHRTIVAPHRGGAALDVATK